VVGLRPHPIAPFRISHTGHLDQHESAGISFVIHYIMGQVLVVESSGCEARDNLLLSPDVAYDAGLGSGVLGRQLKHVHLFRLEQQARSFNACSYAASTVYRLLGRRTSSPIPTISLRPISNLLVS
jgi:hypothetical protein